MLVVSFEKALAIPKSMSFRCPFTNTKLAAKCAYIYVCEEENWMSKWVDE
jgi:hypothetical protein